MRDKDSYELIMQQGTEMIEFYRNNPCIAAYDLLRVDLAPVQRLVFEDMWFKNYVITVASRGLGKTFLLATLATLSCLLYPGYRVGLIAPVFRQSKLIFAEVEKLYTRSPIVREAAEKRPVRGSDTCYLKFKSVHGVSPSYIESMPLGDGCLTYCNYLTFNDRFDKISSGYDLDVTDNHYKEQEEIVWGNGRFRNSDRSLCNGIKDTIKIKTKKGFESEGTPNHMFKVVRSGEIIWCRFDEMIIGDKILIDRSYRWHHGDSDVTKEQAYALGLVIGDGSWTNKYYLRFATMDEELVESLNLGTGLIFKKCGDGVHYNHNSKNNVSNWLKFWELDVSYTKNKKLPAKILSAKREVMSACISGLYDTDGYIQVSTLKGGTAITIGFTNTSKELIDQLQYILLHYGIVAYKIKRDRNIKWNPSYELLITGSDVKKFHDEIGFGLKRKQAILEAAISNKVRWVMNDYIPDIQEDMIRISESKRIKKGNGCLESRSCGASNLKDKKNINRRLAEHFIKSYGDTTDPAISKIRNLVNENIYYDEVVSIEFGSACTYDRHIPEGNEYCANGFFSHNSKIRGSRFYLVVIDELAQVPDKILDMVIRPMAATTLEPMENVRRLARQKRLIDAGLAVEDDFDDPTVNKMIMASSGFYKFNHMWRRMKDYWRQMDEDKRHGYSVWQIPHWDLPEGFLDANNINEARRVMSESEFRMEYEAAMISDSEGFFKASLVESCTMSDCLLESRGAPGTEYILGVDPAQGGKASCGFVIIRLGSPNKIVTILELKRKTTQEITKTTQSICENYNVVRIFMDKGGGGKAIMDLLEEGYDNREPIIDRTDEDKIHLPGRHILEMVNFNPSWIADANFTTLSLLEDRKLVFSGPPLMAVDILEELYESTRELKRQMLNIIVTQTSTGILHFDTPKKDQKKDLYSALILAAHGVRMFAKEMEAPTDPILHNSSGFVREHRPNASWNLLDKSKGIGPQTARSRPSLNYALLKKPIK